MQLENVRTGFDKQRRASLVVMHQLETEGE